MTKEKAKEWLYKIVKYPTEDTIIELVSELEEQITNLQEMLKVERSVTCKEEYLKRIAELEEQIKKMKRCFNCKYRNKFVESKCGECEDYSKWEITEE